MLTNVVCTQNKPLQLLNPRLPNPAVDLPNLAISPTFCTPNNSTTQPTRVSKAPSTKPYFQVFMFITALHSGGVLVKKLDFSDLVRLLREANKPV